MAEENKNRLKNKRKKNCVQQVATYLSEIDKKAAAVLKGKEKKILHEIKEGK